MTAEQSKKQIWRKMAAWLITIACLVGIPAALLSLSTIRYYSVIEDELKLNLKMRLQQATNEAMQNLSQEQFWCRFFFNKFARFRADQSSLDEIIAWLQEVQKTFPGEVDHIVWDKSGKQLAMSFASEHSTKEWHEVISLLASFDSLSAPSRDFGYKNASIDNVRKILGPQFLSSMLSSTNDPADFSLGWTDCAGNKPPNAAYFTGNGGVLLLFNQEKLQYYSGLKHSLQQFAVADHFSYGILDKEEVPDQQIWMTRPGLSKKILAATLADCENQSLNFFELSDYYIGYQHLSPDLRIFACGQRNLSNTSIAWRALLVALLYTTLMAPFLFHTWKTSIKGETGKVSIRYKLAFLFLFASGIPLLAMVIISQEHYSQKRQTLMTEIQQNSIDLLLNIDRRYLSAQNSTSTRLDQYFSRWSKAALNQAFSIELNNLIASHLATFKAENYFMVASASKTIGSKAGFFHYHGEMDNITIDTKKSTANREISEVIKSDLTAANMVAKKLMNDLNRVEIPGHTLSKLEIVVESILQKTFTEITHSIISSLGRINKWGFAQVKDFTYFKFISLKDVNITDYVVMVFWRPMAMQHNFLLNALPAANKNPHGFKLIARNRITNDYVPETPDREGKLQSFAMRLGPKPTQEIEVLSLAGEDYMALGFNAQQLDFFQIILLYPLKNIEFAISRQKTDLLLLGLFSLLLAAGLAQILSQSFVKPLNILRRGALAIENRHFSHRIAAPGKDEFGEVAEIFNDVMVGFEELEVAKIVQESLFPQPDFCQDHCHVYGKSICMSELGGDYLDFFKIDEDHIAVLMGDVAGHGVGAALIMAMAKSGILSSKHRLSSPQDLLLSLHQMILASKNSRQKKVMTFQYMCFNSKTCVGTYSNAGGCSPLIFRRNNSSIEELQLSGAALGAFKKSSYCETSVNLGPGDAIIFYTDGIIESRDNQGREIGYDGFATLLKQAYNENPQTYYDNVLALYLQHIGIQDAQDDLTLIIMVCPPSAKASI